MTEMRGAVLFPQEGRPEEMTPAQISQKPPKEVKPKSTDRMAIRLPFSVRAKPGLVPPSGFFCLPPPPRLLASLFLRTDEVYVRSCEGSQEGCEQGQPRLGGRRMGRA